VTSVETGFVKNVPIKRTNLKPFKKVNCLRLSRTPLCLANK